MSDRPVSVAALLRGSAPDRLVETVDRHVRTSLGARRSDVLVADYRIAGLWSVLRPSDNPSEALSDRGAAARCFSSQQAVLDDGAAPLGVRLHVPLTAWGERLGVLLVDFPTRPPAATVAAVCDLAGDLAVAIRAADRDTDRYRRARRRGRLTMAAELQWDLIPGRTVAHDAYLLAGQLEPAYEVGGDNFDWAVDGDLLTVTALNGDGNGLRASLLTALAVNAMRNARRSGGGLVEQAELASETVFAEHRGARHLATLLLEFDAGTGQVRAVDAGSPWALRMRQGRVDLVELEHQLPLGMFGDTHYEPQEFQLRRGDRLFVVSDGVHAAAPGHREPYGLRALSRAIRATRLQPVSEAVGTVIRELHAYHGGTDLADDALVICLDWLA